MREVDWAKIEEDRKALLLFLVRKDVTQEEKNTRALAHALFRESLLKSKK